MIYQKPRSFILQMRSRNDETNHRILEKIDISMDLLHNYIKIAKTPIGYLVFIARNDKEAVIYSLPEFELFQTLQTDSNSNHISVSEDGRLLLICKDNLTASLYKMNREGYYEIFHMFDMGDFGSSISKDANYFALLNSNNRICVFSKENLNKPLKIFQTREYTVPKFSPFYNDVLVYYYCFPFQEEISVIAIDIKENRKQEIRIPGKRVYGMTFSGKGDKLFIAYADSENKSIIRGYFCGKDKTIEKLRVIMEDVNFMFE